MFVSVLSLVMMWPVWVVSSSQCPPGWHDTSIADMGCLWFGNVTETWYEASRICNSLQPGAQLLEIRSSEEIWTFLDKSTEFVVAGIWLFSSYNGFPGGRGGGLFNDFKANLTSLRQVGSHYWWVGGSDLSVEGGWVWTSSGLAVGDFLWHSDQPDGLIGHDCLLLSNIHQYSGFDNLCGAHFDPICQLQPQRLQ